MDHLEKMFQNVKNCVEQGVAIHHQIDMTKFQSEGKVTIRIFINFKEKAPTMAEAFPNPFKDLPECEEPIREDGIKPKEDES